jgi:hypothetical protein
LLVHSMGFATFMMLEKSPDKILRSREPL